MARIKLIVVIKACTKLIRFILMEPSGQPIWLLGDIGCFQLIFLMERTRWYTWSPRRTQSQFFELERTQCKFFGLGLIQRMLSIMGRTRFKFNIKLEERT